MTLLKTTFHGAKATALALALLVCSGAALADSVRMPAAPKAYLSECGSCHMAFPPSLMLARDWKSTLSGLNKHFGTDASLTPAELNAIEPYLLTHAATDANRFDAQAGAAGAAPRLTQTAWFARKHLRKLPADVWSNPKVKSAANCMACHTQADKGSYAEHEISVPGHAGRHW